MPGTRGLPKSARLRTGAEFRRVFDQRQACGNALFRVHYAPSSAARLGMAVSRRVSPRAVVRNRIRRQIRETFRLAAADLMACDYVVLARAPAASASRAELQAALNQLWQRLT